MDALQLRLGETGLPQPFEARGVGLAAAQRADVARRAVEGDLQRRVIHFRIVRQNGEAGGGVDRIGCERALRIGDQQRIGMGKSLWCGEYLARVDDSHVVAQRPRDGDKGDRDLRAADDVQARRRLDDIDESETL